MRQRPQRRIAALLSFLTVNVAKRAAAAWLEYPANETVTSGGFGSRGRRWETHRTGTAVAVIASKARTMNVPLRMVREAA